jgi:hypothetical protein
MTRRAFITLLGGAAEAYSTPVADFMVYSGSLSGSHLENFFFAMRARIDDKSRRHCRSSSRASFAPASRNRQRCS